MGIQDIIKDGLDDTPTNNIFINDAASDDELIPIAENIYSDASSDTELFDDDSDLSHRSNSSMSSTNSLENDLDELESRAIYDSLLESTHQHALQSRLLSAESPTFTDIESHPPAAEPLTFIDRPPLQKKFKNVSSKSRQGVGKKKARRIENARQLDQMRGDDDVGDCDINDFMPVDCSFRFSKILEDINLANKVLNPCVDNLDVDFDFAESSKNARVKHSKENPSKRKKLSAQAAFNNLYASEKDLFRRRNLPMGIVQYLDTCVLSFFEENPTGTYVSEPLSSFERMVLHSIAHFYELKSYSFNAENFNCRLTKVTNSFDCFVPPCLCLSKYVEQLTSKDSNHNSRKCKRFRRR